MKGQIQVQFNWIFVIIVGGIIILFFSNIVLKQREISDSKVALTVINDLETIATGAGISTGTAQILEKPDIDLELDCGLTPDSCDCRYSMSSNTKRFGDKLIFGPKKIQGRDMIAWTLDWKAPFRVTNFLMLTSPRTAYFFIGNSNNNIKPYINETIPSTIEAYYLNRETAVPDYNYGQIKLIFLNNQEPSSASHFKSFGLEPQDISAVMITGADAPTFENANVQFYKIDSDWNWKKDSSEIECIGDESMFAAIFANSHQNFACNLKQGFKRLETIAKIYKRRSGELQCPDGSTVLYEEVIDQLELLITQAGRLSNNTSHPLTDYHNIQGELNSFNTQFGLKSCPYIY